VQFPHRFSRREDKEIAAFLAATIAWGRRDIILRSAEKLFALLDNSPFDFVMAGNYRRLKDRPIHRTFFEKDLKYFCRGFKHCYEKYGNLETLFVEGMKMRRGGVSPYGQARKRSRPTPSTGDKPPVTPPKPPLFNNDTAECDSNYAEYNSNSIAEAPAGIWEALSLFRETMAEGNGGASSPLGEYSKHIADPRSASACKRLNLCLRWLVRREGPVDLGLWKRLDPADLYIPLDIHVGRVARTLGLLDPARKANDRKAVVSLTAKLREFCPEDPARYDLALFGWGVEASR
jgi:hypothetical protein